MKAISFRWIYLIILGLAFYLGHLSNLKSPDRVSHSKVHKYRSVASASGNVISYEKLECPTEEEYKRLAETVHFVGTQKLDGELCDDKSDKDKFAKLLKYISKLRISIPNDWKGGANDALRNTLKYLAEKNNQIDLDFSERATWIAQNKSRGNIYLASRFFNLDPLEALSALVHETRHSSPVDPRHVRCRFGDSAQLHACDSWFQTDAFAGAYAYTVSFNFGLAKYGEKLSQTDREFLIADGLHKLAHRFVSVPSSLGLPFETVMVLSESNTLYYIHPILKKPIKYDYGDKLDLLKIKFNRLTNGLFFLTRDGAVYLAHPFSAKERYRPSFIKEGWKVKDIEFLTHSDNKLHRHFIDWNNRISYLGFNIHTRKHFLDKSDFQDPGANFIQLIQAHGMTRYILTEDGELRFFQTNKSGENEIAEDVFQDPRGQGWLHIDGGRFYEEIFGVNKGGELWVGFRERKEDQIKKSTFQVSGSRLYLEPISFRLQFNDDGDIFIKKYEEDDVLELNFSNDGIKPQSVAFIRSFLPSKIFKIERQVPDNIKLSCNLSIKSSVDPWTNLAMGINEDKQLVFQISESTCEAVQLGSGVEDYKFSGTEVKGSGDFSKIYIEVTLENGDKKKIQPYSF